jgi:predicted nucleic acid-binding protein
MMPRTNPSCMSYSGIGGHLVNDAHLATLALQYGATVITYDHDFALFPSVRWERLPTSRE